MSVIVTRAGKGAPLSWVEADANFTNLNLDKVEESELASSTGSSMVGYLPNGTGAVTTTVQEKLRESVSVKDFGAIGYGATNDTAAIQAALNSTATDIYFPAGTYLIRNPAGSSSTSPALTSSVANRVLHGPGVITTDEQIKVALEVSGANSKVHLNVDGNLNIGYAIRCTGDRAEVSNCYIHNLDGKDNWGGIGVLLSFGANDYSGVVRDNRIENLQGVGDGTGGNGVGMQRAVLIQSSVDCTDTTLVTGNVIKGVWGEEGDAITIQGGDTVTPKKVPCTIEGNVIEGWSRRAIKIAAENVTVQHNYLTNPLSTALNTLQRAIDATVTANFAVIGNILYNCKFQLQIAVVLEATMVGNNITVKDNVIRGINTAGASGLIVLRTYGQGVVVQGNIIDWPDHTTTAIDVTQASDVTISGNDINVGTISWLDVTGSTNVRLDGNTNKSGGSYQQYYNAITGDHVIDTSSGTKRVVLYNRDSTLTDGETISALACMGNDTSNPNSVLGSVRFVAEGTSGNTAVAFHTGDGTTPDTEKVRVSNGGRLLPKVDNTQTLGNVGARWSSVYAGNVVLSPAASVTPVTNGDVMVQLTNNTSLTFKVKGSDGVVRSASLTLA